MRNKDFINVVIILIGILYPVFVLGSEKLPFPPNVAWVGKYNSSKISFGRIFQGPWIMDSRKDALNYTGGLYLWVGAKVYGNKPYVSSGDGNHITGKNEWFPIRWKKLDTPVMEIDAIVGRRERVDVVICQRVII